MTLAYNIHPQALDELDSAAIWYDRGRQERGQQFSIDYYSVMDRLLKWPMSAPVYPLDRSDLVVRIAGVPHSAYHIIYFVEDETLNVVAVAHDRRRPGYWRDRVPTSPH